MEDEILAATRTFAAALGRGDADGAASCYADGAKLLTPAASLIAGRGEIEAYWRAGLLLGLTGVELAATGVELAEELAVELGRYTLAFDGDGNMGAHDAGKYLVLHRREAGGPWRRAVDVFNPDVPERGRLDHRGGS
jgi:ketosteroid isomerase-like protein